MNYQDYQELFDSILGEESHKPPYNDSTYLHYTKLNQMRMKRWDKQLQLNKSLCNSLKNLSERQEWIIVAEPWCGDAAHSIPFLVRLTEQSQLITYDIQLRDSEPFLIDSYLTNGAKSIPKLIVRDKNGSDKYTWGPRPDEAQQIVDELKALNTEYDVIADALQRWYNQDKGLSICEEIAEHY